MDKKFNQMEYIKDFDKKNYKKYYFRVRKDNEKVIEYLNSIPNKTGYIISLIEQDMAKK